MTAATAVTGDKPRIQITKAQHIFPRSCLRPFAGRGGKLQVGDLLTGQVTPVGPDHPRFTTDRSWDQRTEGRVMHGIETEFGRVVAPIRNGLVHSVRPDQQQAVSALYVLWMLRAHRAREPMPDLTLNRIWLEDGAARSEAVVDEMELHGIITVNPGGIVLGRQMAGPQLQLDLDRALNDLADMKWSVIRAVEGAGEFVIPDSPEGVLYLPLAPRIALVCGVADGQVGREDVTAFNTVAFQHCRAFVAAMDLSACPFVSVLKEGA